METTITTINQINETAKGSNSVDTVADYTQLIHTYGASAVIIAIFMFVLLAILVFILRNSQKTNNQIIKQQQDLVNMIVDMAKRGEDREINHKPTKEPNLVEMFLDINNSIKDILKDIARELDTDRASVYVFHNGVFSSHGLPFFKISCVCEIVKNGVGVVKNLKNHSSLPLQMLDNTMSNIYKNGYMTVADALDEDDLQNISCPVLCGMLKNNNIRSATSIAIYDHDNNIMGILVVEYTGLKSVDFLKDTTKYLITKAPLLSPVLEYSGIYNITNK
jgi:hypothetical protein